MRKWLYFFTMVFLLTSCEEEGNHVINNSDYSVTFTFYGFKGGPHTIEPHKSDYFHARTISIESYSATPPRVSYRTDNQSEVEFYNTPGRSVKIINGLNKDVLVTASGCMDNEPILIQADNEIIGSLHSSKLPTFNGITAIDKFPVNFTYSVDQQTVIVHW